MCSVNNSSFPQMELKTNDCCGEDKAGSSNLPVTASSDPALVFLILIF